MHVASRLGWRLRSPRRAHALLTRGWPRAPARRSLIRSWSCRAVTEIKAMANKAMATTTRVSECTATKRLDDAAHDENGMVLQDDAAEFDAVDGVPHVEMACALPCQGHTRKRTLPAPPMPTAGRRAAAALHHRAHRLRAPPHRQAHRSHRNRARLTRARPPQIHRGFELRQAKQHHGHGHHMGCVEGCATAALHHYP